MTRRFATPLALVAALALTGCPIIVNVDPAARPSIRPPSASPAATPNPVQTPKQEPSTQPATATPWPSVRPMTPGPNDTPGPGRTPGPNETPGPSVFPSAPSTGGPRLVVTGMVYDEAGEPVDGALVRVRSLDSSVPYEATATTAQGAWVFNNIPEGANVEIQAMKDGWTTRRRVGSYQIPEAGQRVVVAFGAPAAGVDAPLVEPAGAAYFLSDRPEVVHVTPADDETQVDATTMAVKLAFSEPFSEEDRAAIVDALRIWPANAAAGAPGAYDLERDVARDRGDGLAASGLDFSVRPVPATIGYVVANHTTFLDVASVRATSVWNAEGTEVTLTFDAPYVNGSAAAAKYQVGLVAGSRAIEDQDGNPLGTDHQGALNRQPAANRLIANAFRATDLGFRADANGGMTAADRWAQTHDSATSFELAPDTSAPKLVGVEVADDGPDAVLRLAFSEAMVAFDGTAAGRADARTIGDAALGRYTFALGARAGDLDQVELTGAAPKAIDPRSVAAIAAADFGRELAFAPGSGRITFAFDAQDPKALLLRIGGRAGFFAGARAIKARAAGVADPAGNVVTAADADDQQVQGAL